MASTFIQWKGTDVCMDVYCDCGEHFHVDGMFAYNIQCPHCNRVYVCGTTVELTPLNGEKPDVRLIVVGEK